MIKLSKVFNREHTLFYAYMWNRSDRLGFKKWLNHNLKNSLFLKEKGSNKVSVWYQNKEFNQIRDKIARKFKQELLLNKLAKELQKEERSISLFLSGKIKIKNINQLKEYYRNITRWWSAMVILFEIPDLKNISENIRQESLNLRILSEKYSDQQDNIFIDFWRKKYPQLNNLTFLIKPSEVFNQKEMDEKNVKNIIKRKEGYCIFNNKFYLLSDFKSKMNNLLIELDDNEIEERINEFKGLSAMSGKIRGLVKIIKYKRELNKIKRGDILVAEMTSPDYASVFEKIKGIITDEGGITCHAAIVARELKIPCIIGAKIATKVLKDGDLVEVDANKGIVKIIKKKNA